MGQAGMVCFTVTVSDENVLHVEAMFMCFTPLHYEGKVGSVCFTTHPPTQPSFHWPLGLMVSEARLVLSKKAPRTVIGLPKRGATLPSCPKHPQADPTRLCSVRHKACFPEDK